MEGMGRETEPQSRDGTRPRLAQGQAGHVKRGTDRDGEQPPGHLHHRGIAEVAGEERDVDGG